MIMNEKDVVAIGFAPNDSRPMHAEVKCLDASPRLFPGNHLKSARESVKNEHVSPSFRNLPLFSKSIFQSFNLCLFPVLGLVQHSPRLTSKVEQGEGTASKEIKSVHPFFGRA